MNWFKKIKLHFRMKKHEKQMKLAMAQLDKMRNRGTTYLEDPNKIKKVVKRCSTCGAKKK